MHRQQVDAAGTWGCCIFCITRQLWLGGRRSELADQLQGAPAIGGMAFRRSACRCLPCRGKAEGATLAAGGARHGSKGYFVEPTVFADVKDSMTISREEIFGPVQCITKFDSLAEVSIGPGAVEEGHYGAG